MNTLTIAILVVCATMAYASALPGNSAKADEGAPIVAAAPAEDLQGDESRHGGGGYYRGGGGYHGGYQRWGGYHNGGGRRWGK